MSTTASKSRSTAVPRRASGLVGVAVVVTAFGGAAAAPASASDAASAVVRSAHFSPDTAGVDVYLAPFSGGGATTLWVSNEGYGAISSYHRITPGAYTVSMRPHGAPASTKPTLSWTLNAKAGAAYTAAAIGTNAELRAVVLTDDLTPPAAGTGRVRVVQAANAAPSVSVEANGGVALAAKLPFGSTSAYKAVPTGRWDVRAVPDAGTVGPVTSSLAVPAGSSSTLVVVDGGSTLALKSVQDSASAGTMPAGSVDAGGGGTAVAFAGTGGDDHPWTGWALGGAVLLLATAGTVAVSRRRRAGA